MLSSERKKITLSPSENKDNFSRTAWLTNQAVTKEQKGEIEEAIAFYVEAIKLSNNQPAWVYRNVITLLTKVNQLDQGLDLGEKALIIYPKSDEIRRAIEIIYEKRNHLVPENSEQNIIDRIDYLHTQAVVKHKENKLEEAIAFYVEAIELDKNQPAWVYGNTITLLAEVNNVAQGLNLGEKAENLYPESDEIYRALGLVYEKQQDTINCIKKYRQAINIQPEQPNWLYFNLAKQLLKNEKTEEASAISQQGIQFYQKFYPLYYITGKAFAAQEKWDQAISYYRQVQELNPNWLEIEQHLDQVIYQKNQAARLSNKYQYEPEFIAKKTTPEVEQKSSEVEPESLEVKPEASEVEPEATTSDNIENHPEFNLETAHDLDIHLLFSKLQKGVLDFASCQTLWNNYQGDKLILNYGCWLSPHILYLETTVENCWVLNEAEILVVSPNKYGIAKANFFQISHQQVVGVACFTKDLYLEDYDNYNLYLKYNQNPLFVAGTISQKAYSLEFIEHLKTKPDYQKHLIRESLSNSIIKLIPEVFKSEAGTLLKKFQYFLDIPPSNYVDPNLPFKIFIDYIIPLKSKGLFISGWLQDAYQMLEEIIAISALGFNLKLSSQDIYRIERRDVNEFLQNTRYGNFEGNLGFCAYAAVPDTIRQSIEGFAELHSFRFLVRLKGNIEVEIIPDVKYSDFYNARRQVMQITSPDKVSESMLTNCIAPVGLKLQQLCIEQAKIKDLTIIGTPVKDPLVSIVIPLYRRLDFMKVQLATMANDPTTKECEIIYVLDSPEQEEELRTFLLNHCTLYQLPVKLIVMERNSGYAAANNAGASQATGKYLVLLNSDVFAKTKGWVLKMAQFYANSPKVGALGAKLVYEDGALQHAGMFFAQTTFPFWLTLHYYKGLPGNYALAQQTRAVPAVTGACLMIRKELYDQVGGLTTDYVIGDFEDSDLCLKCGALGYESWYFADATLYHLERQSVPLNAIYNGSLAWRLNGRLHQERWGKQIAKLMNIHQE